MINYLAKKITNYYIKKNKIQEEERETYEYCFDVLLSTTLNLLAIVIISVATELYIEGLIFTIVFMTMRGVGGGYHANTHLSCFLTIMAIFAGYVTILKLVPEQIIFYISIALLGVGFILTAIMAPVDNENKPLTIKEYKKNKIKTIIILSFYVLVCATLMIFKVTRYYSFNISYPLFMVSMLMVLGWLKNLKWKKKDSIKIVKKNVDIE